jgi:hypothetical protein
MNPITVAVGHVVNMQIAYLDQNGQPMATTPTPDSPPSWSNSNTAVGSIVAAAGGLTATEAITGAGSDTASVSLSVGGVAFVATLPISATAVTPPAQVLTSIQIQGTAV